MRFTQVSQLAMLGMASLAAAHPGHHDGPSVSELKQRREAAYVSHRSLEKCAGKLEASGFNKRAAERRRNAAELLRRSDQKFRKRGHPDVMARDEASVLATSHNHTDEGITLDTSIETLFASNGTCVLNPVSEFGPFWVKGEYVRSDLVEGQEGVPVVIDGQFIDAETCEPIQGLYWDMWNCNSTGVYSGVVASNNGNGNDQSNINATFLRGIQPSDEEGVVQFSTLFPGHYSGRATHTHVIAHLNASLNTENNTLSGGNVAYVGHLFWDQDLIYEIEATYPYNTNDIALTENADDSIFPNEAAITDPVFNYVYLGDSVEDGLFAWITVAINTSATYTESYSFELTSNGGQAAENSGDINGGGAGGAPTGGAGGFPSGGAGGPGGANATGAVPSDIAISTGSVIVAETTTTEIASSTTEAAATATTSETASTNAAQHDACS